MATGEKPVVLPYVRAPKPKVKRSYGFRVTPTVKVFAGMVEALPAAHKLWHTCLSIDKQGSGYVAFSVAEVMEWLGVTKATIKRWLKSGKRDGLFRWFSKSRKGIIRVALVSRRKICERYGIELGACTELRVTELGTAKYEMTYAQAVYLQNASWHRMHKAQQEIQGRAKPIVNKPQDVLPGSGAYYGQSRGPHVIYQGERCTFVDEGFTQFGTSIPGIGSSLSAGLDNGRTPRTVRRRLSNQTRFQKGLYAVNRRQLGIKGEPGEDLKKDAQAIAFHNDGEEADPLRRWFRCSGRWFMSGCNIYEDLIQLYPARRIRARTMGLQRDGRLKRQSVAPKGVAPCCALACPINLVGTSRSNKDQRSGATTTKDLYGGR